MDAIFLQTVIPVALMSQLTYSIHLYFVLHLLLLLPRSYHLFCLSSDVVFVSYLHMANALQSSFPLPVGMNATKIKQLAYQNKLQRGHSSVT